jgi:hypothetical protein
VATNGIDFRAQYERLLMPRVVVSEEPDAGWSGLKWKGWGEAHTRWLRSPHPGIRRQAKVPGVADCLQGG